MEISFNIYDSINNIIFQFETSKEKYFLAKSTFEKYIFNNWEKIIEKKNKPENIILQEKMHQEKIDTENNNLNNIYDENPVKINKTHLPSYSNISPPMFDIKNYIKKFNKKLYRKIAVKSHPDKILNKEKNFLFVKANQFYENNLSIGLIFIARKLEIEINIKNIKLIKYLLKELSLTENKINQMKKSFFWIWYFSNSQIKNIVENKFIKENKLVKKKSN